VPSGDQLGEESSTRLCVIGATFDPSALAT
jgi:hypothetical protein